MLKINPINSVHFRLRGRLFLLIGVYICLCAPAQAHKWTIMWRDEFKGARGSGVDAMKWRAEIGGSGWGNQELEYYTDSAENAHLNGDGSLVIEALNRAPSQDYKCWYGLCRYTSARLTTKTKFNQAYGRIEARIKLPYGQGMWPAFWMLGSNIDASGWPDCGEIDIMENIGREPSIVHGTIHGPGYSGAGSIGAPYTLKSGQRFTNKYHIFSVEWEPNVIRWYVDHKLYETRTPTDLPAGTKWAYNHPFFIILNLAVGGTWPGNPAGTTIFPQAMSIDYIRVYRR